MASQWLAKQLNGPLAQGTINGIETDFTIAKPETDYMYNISIATAEADAMLQIGRIVGFPWPSAPTGEFDANKFRFGAAASFPKTDYQQGFSGVGLVTGGPLSSIVPAADNLVPIGTYKKILAVAASIKYNGLSIKTVDEAVAIFSDTYTIGWNSDNDVTVTFNPNLDTGSWWILEQTFLLFATEPQVIMVQGGS